MDCCVNRFSKVELLENKEDEPLARLVFASAEIKEDLAFALTSEAKSMPVELESAPLRAEELSMPVSAVLVLVFVLAAPLA